MVSSGYALDLPSWKMNKGHTLGSNKMAGAWALMTSQSRAVTPILYGTLEKLSLAPNLISSFVGSLLCHTAITGDFLPPLSQPLLKPRHSLFFLLGPLQPLLLLLLPADEDASDGHSGGNDGSNDAPDDAPRGPCACCVGRLCKEKIG